MIDDDPAVAQRLEEPLSRHNVKVEKANGLETALYKFNTIRFDVVVVEIEFNSLPGLAFVQKWRQHEIMEKRCTAFIMASGNKNIEINESLINELGDLESITKPFTAINLLPYLSRGMATKQRLLAFQELRDKLLEYSNKPKDIDKVTQQIKSRLHELGNKGFNLIYELYEKAGKYTEALEVVNPLLDQEPGNITLINAKGRLLMRLQRFSEAKTYLERSDAIAPDNIDRINQLAIAFLQLNDPSNAVERFKQVLALSPEDPEIKFKMFSQLFESGFESHAINFGKETTKPNEIVRHYNNKGVLLSKDGALDKALAEYQRALKFYPKFRENYKIHYNIALNKIDRKDQASILEAKNHLDTCLKLEPDFSKAQSTLESVERILSQFKKTG